jgi:hypothetical protein
MEHCDSYKLDSENFKDITMDNQQETKDYLVFIEKLFSRIFRDYTWTFNILLPLFIYIYIY